MQTIHISGASGFLGKKLCNFYLKEGLAVNAIIRSGSEKNFPKTWENIKFTYIDTANIGDLYFSMMPGEFLIHTASSNPPSHKINLMELLNANVGFGLQLMEIANSHNGRFLNIGTIWQHFKNERYNPVSIYAASKEAHQAFQEYFQKVENLESKTLELCDTYGPEDPRDKLIPMLVNSTKESKEIKLTSGNQFIDLVHIDDVVGAVDSIIRNWNSHSDVFRMSLTSGKLLTIRELVQICGEIKGFEIAVEWGAAVPQIKRQMEESWAYYPAPLGWTPKINLLDGLKTILDFEKNIRGEVDSF